MLVPPDSSFVADVAGLTFVGRDFDHQPGYYVTGVEGLILGGSTSYEQLASGGRYSDGELDLPNDRTGPRIITLTGFAYGRTMWELGRLLIALSGALAERNDVGPFDWLEFGERFSTLVRRGTNAPARRRGSTGFADFTIRFRAPSQRVYGASRGLIGPASAITLENRGNFHTLPIITITGNMPGGYQLTAAGFEYVVEQALAPGQTHTVDMRDRILLRNGVAQPGAVSKAERIAIPAGHLRTITLDPVSGSGQISAVEFDTYI
ncbi:hypothetical protein [Microbacterium dauci]|uniref:Phage tail protein n=1 Tax=Microbacterium dauci TaxID=3048008 RepID=A0ABT6ZAQ4_9MICO|nr:hypothetical protein [Microbacterium sp. LX3-4]MDJ1113241.1 hypothetical protein [Microbacterium sp. LX3-4]